MSKGRRLFGREREFGLLRDLLLDTKAGRGRLAVMEGEAGIGKSELLAEALAFAREQDLTVLSSGAHELGQDHPFGAIADALDLRASGSPERAALAELLAAGSRPEHRVNFEVLEGILALVEKLALERPVIFAVDDLHWADPSSLRVLYHLARSTTSLPVTLLVTLRSLPRRDELERFLRSSSLLNPLPLSLEPLNAQAVEALIAELVGGRPGNGLLRYMAGTGGNPLLVRELAIALRQTDALSTDDGHVELVSAALPSSFRPLVLRRLDSLPPDTRQLLRMASILGARFSVAELAGVLDRIPSDLMTALDAALRDGLIAEAGADLVFRHELVRDAIYLDVPLSLRRALHSQAGRSLAQAGAPPVKVASHLRLGAGPGETEAAEWLHRAAIEAMASAPANSVDLLEQALELVGPNHPGREELLLDRVLALVWAGRPRDCVVKARETLPILAGTAREARLRHVLALGLIQLGSYGEAADEIEKSAARPGITGMESSRLLADAALACILSGEAHRGAQLAGESTRIAEQVGDEMALSIGLSYLGMVAYMEARVSDAVDMTQRAVTLAQRSQDAEAAGRPVHLWHGLALADAERFEESAEALQAGYRASQAAGLPWHQALYHLAAARGHLLTGEWDDAVAEMETSIMLAEELETGGVIPQQYAYLSYIALQRGDPEKAQAHLTAAEQVMTAEGVHFGIQVMLWIRALMVEAAGNSKDAFDLLCSAWSMLGNGYFTQYQTLGPDMVRLALAVGDRAQAQLAVAGVELAARNSGLPSARGIALRCRGQLEGDTSLLEAAVASLRQSRRRVELAFACEDAGVALWHDGRNAEAVGLLEEARLEYYRVGARKPMARATAALRALGVRHREPGLGRRPSVGWAALTPTELSVINLVTRGLTSREIGAQLSISRRTVETHLAHSFSKLGVSSRVQLAIAYARQHEGEQPAASLPPRVRS
ncbi:MAG: AAA family ATPase [Candidatus Dormibacteraeota bacterium]|nr:AAA family ATPase [Candidatus Dormibacteraeota bacterium]